MRIIGGEHGRRRFSPPANMPHTRPTTDVAKEGLFNVISNNLDIEELKTLDLFGGTGSISYELASRGANDLTAVDLRLYVASHTPYKARTSRFSPTCRSTSQLPFAAPH